MQNFQGQMGFWRIPFLQATSIPYQAGRWLPKDVSVTELQLLFLRTSFPESSTASRACQICLRRRFNHLRNSEKLKNFLEIFGENRRKKISDGHSWIPGNRDGASMGASRNRWIGEKQPVLIAWELGQEQRKIFFWRRNGQFFPLLFWSSFLLSLGD